jgi:glyoxylase-like metal-dependent hydrolase (beta-lactamase superfamily II)
LTNRSSNLAGVTEALTGVTDALTGVTNARTTSTPRPVKSEQLDASPEIIEVAPSILRLQLQIEFTGLGHVNTYALEDKNGFAIVDPGLPGEVSWKLLQERLAAAEIPLERVHTVVVTHSHPDHFGGAGLLAEESGAQVMASTFFRTWWDPNETDEELEEARDAGADDDLDDGVQRINGLPTPFGRPTPWGGRTEQLPPERLAEIERNASDAQRWFRVPKVSIRVDDSDHVRLAGRDWIGLFTPGHTNDHLCLYDQEHGVLLSGDHVLPTITPHISGMIDDDPLSLYVTSLDRVAALPDMQIVLPAHGHPFTDLPKRVDEIKDHHEGRLERLRELSDDSGWASVQQLSQQLFAERNWGSMAESETYAHLEHMRLAGNAERREQGGLLEYRVS